MVRPGSSSNRVVERNNTGVNNIRYKGVRMRKWGKWVAEIRLPNSRDRVWLGSYDTPEKAARAYDAAVYCLRGPTAGFNFPNAAPPDVPMSRDLSNQQIQTLASRYANNTPNPQVQMVVEDGHVNQQVPESSPTSQVQNPNPAAVQLNEDEEEMPNWGSMDPMFLPTSSDMFMPGFDDFLGDF